MATKKSKLFQSWEEIEKSFRPRHHQDAHEGAVRRATESQPSGLNMIPLVRDTAASPERFTVPEATGLPIAARGHEAARLRAEIKRLGEAIDDLLLQANRAQEEAENDDGATARSNALLRRARKLMDQQTTMMREHAVQRMHLPLGQGYDALKAAEALLGHYADPTHSDPPA